MISSSVGRSLRNSLAFQLSFSSSFTVRSSRKLQMRFILIGKKLTMFAFVLKYSSALMLRMSL